LGTIPVLGMSIHNFGIHYFPLELVFDMGKLKLQKVYTI
jgi:hypothetical protein